MSLGILFTHHRTIKNKLNKKGKEKLFPEEVFAIPYF